MYIPRDPDHKKASSLPKVGKLHLQSNFMTIAFRIHDTGSSICGTNGNQGLARLSFE